ncbi:MAG TPA: ABC transporter permease [Solirubrobacterales bacterium]|nr:ABC transporter permease [Solirubrobacterales bacterium]
MSQLRAVAAIFQRDLRIFLSYRALALSTAFSSVFSVALFYYVARLLSVKEFKSPDDYFAFVVVGLVILAVVQSTLVLSAALRAELVAGTFERVLLSPFGGVRGALSMTVFPIVQSIVLSVWTLFVAALFFHLSLRWETLPLALPVAILAALSFSAIALLVTALLIVFKQAPGLGVLIAGVTLISGLYFPTDLLPGWISWTSEVQPFTPSVDLLRNLLVGLPLPESAWLCLLKLVAFLLVLVPIGIWALVRAIAISQRRGTIIEY